MSPVLARGVQWDDGTSSATTTIKAQIDASVPSQIAPLSRATESPSFKQQGIALETKIGLSIVPVIVFLCALWLLFLFWLRKRHTLREIQPMTPRRASTTAISTLGEAPNSRMKMIDKEYDIERPMTTNVSQAKAPVDECERHTANPLGGTVCNMKAFRKPIPDLHYRERRIVAKSGLRIQTDMSLFEEQSQVEGAIPFFGNFRMVQPEIDSPIDGKSPFRLKRGDTMRRDCDACSSSGESSYTFPFPQPPPLATARAARGCGERFPTLSFDTAYNVSHPKSRTI